MPAPLGPTRASSSPCRTTRSTPLTTTRPPRVTSTPEASSATLPCTGGAAFVVTTAERARDTVHRPVTVAGFGERLTHKTPTYAAEMPRTPVRDAAARAFGMAGITPADVDMVQLYDCYTITALLTIEDSGFCATGEGMAFVSEHDLSFRAENKPLAIDLVDITHLAAGDPLQGQIARRHQHHLLALASQISSPV